MYDKVFLDANILLDIMDSTRTFSKSSKKVYGFLLKECQVFTSCDIITTLYYVGVKKDKNSILHNIQIINKTLKVIEFSNEEIEQTCTLMLEDENYKDLEDSIQYILAKKYDCDLIISNDKNFVSKDIDLLNSEEFCKKVGI